jgi:hypothetical protein
MKTLAKTILLPSMILALTCGGRAGEPWKAKDLNPVTFKTAPGHPPVTLVKDGQPPAVICAMSNAAGAEDLQKFIAAATGVKLEIVRNKIATNAIVLGDCPEAAALGLVGAKMPPEGFAIKTAPNCVFIAGNGVKWGVYEFLERYIGMRWYFPQETPTGPELGLDIPRTKTLVVPPVWLEDAPVFRLREMWPGCSDTWHGGGVDLSGVQTFLRSGNSWPTRVLVHQPNWSKMEDVKKSSPEVFQLKADGSRDYNVLCYGNPKTLEFYLQGIQNFLDKKQPLYAPISADKAITVSPADVELACYCPDCRKLWDENGGGYGTASKVMATFVDKLAREVAKRWPKEGFTVAFLPYLNYQAAPDGFAFPGNVEAQICGMPGLAAYKEPAILASEQANIDKWIKISGRKIQDWHYNCWPAHKIAAAYQYPHVVKNYYSANRDKTVGTFINGTGNHWPRQHISLYCWLKVLWNPDFDVDAAVDEFCARMFGPAAGTMRELLGMQISGWENSRWPGGRFSPKGVYETSFPREDVKKMEKLFEKARAEAQNDPLVTQRLNYYYTGGLKAFFEESKALCEGAGFKELQIQKVGEAPVLDGKLDDKVWERATANSFIQATGKDQGKPAKYTTTVKGLWTAEGVIFGLRMTEPTPNLLEIKHGGHDNGELWWDDNVEIFLDVTGTKEGLYYQFIINANGDYWDSQLKDTSWEARGMKHKVYRGPDFWSMEVFLPYSAFKDAKIPGSGTDTIWQGNFTRHRIADSMNANKKPDNVKEYQRMNTTGSGSSDNLADFARIKFME